MTQKEVVKRLERACDLLDDGLRAKDLDAVKNAHELIRTFAAALQAIALEEIAAYLSDATALVPALGKILNKE